MYVLKLGGWLGTCMLEITRENTVFNCLLFIILENMVVDCLLFIITVTKQEI